MTTKMSDLRLDTCVEWSSLVESESCMNHIALELIIPPVLYVVTFVSMSTMAGDAPDNRLMRRRRLTMR
jgi:hypothetical protein